MDSNKAEMKERKYTTLHACQSAVYFWQMLDSLFLFLHLCRVSVLFQPHL